MDTGALHYLLFVEVNVTAHNQKYDYLIHGTHRSKFVQPIIKITRKLDIYDLNWTIKLKKTFDLQFNFIRVQLKAKKL